jgi:hypothetical protein
LRWLRNQRNRKHHAGADSIESSTSWPYETRVVSAAEAIPTGADGEHCDAVRAAAHARSPTSYARAAAAPMVLHRRRPTTRDSGVVEGAIVALQTRCMCASAWRACEGFADATQSPGTHSS